MPLRPSGHVAISASYRRDRASPHNRSTPGEILELLLVVSAETKRTAGPVPMNWARLGGQMTQRRQSP